MRKRICFLAALVFAAALSLPVKAAGLPADGTYTAEVTLAGGSGRAGVESPAEVAVAEGRATAVVIWSSPHYAYMLVDGVRYDPINQGGNSSFEIPVVFDTDMPVQAETTAMSTPHLVEYSLRFDAATLKPLSERGMSSPWLIIALAISAAGAGGYFIFRKRKKQVGSLLLCLGLLLPLLAGCGAAPAGDDGSLGNGWQPEGSMELRYAENFAVDYYSGGYALLSLADGSRYLVVPEGGEIPGGLHEEIQVLQRPLENIYLVATSSMCLFDALDALDAIGLSGTRARDWYIENAREAMEAGQILYAGKYNMPDYELIVSAGSDLAIESTMIHHAPEVKDKLESLGVPVLVDQSSHEPHPLGRTEWMKLYAVLTGKEAAAQALFEEQVRYLEDAAGRENTGKTVAFFYISSSGYAVARRSGDYVTKMIQLAGGNYIFEALGDPDSAMGTVNLEMEEFYATAKEADYIIYNSTIGGELGSVEELIAKNRLLQDFKAVQNGNVWCTGKNLFQETTQLGLMVSDIRQMLTQGDGVEELNFLYKLQ